MQREVKLWRAVNEALHEEFANDDRVCMFGEDIGLPGGPFGTAKGLQDRFGTLRVRDTPISEATIVGAGVGAAMAGMRPIVEIMFFDFLGLAMDQLVNHGSKMRSMTAGQSIVPLTVLTLSGARRASGPQHTSSLEGWLAHAPGLKLVYPSTPYDAKGLLKTAIRDDDPVVVVVPLIEWSRSGKVPREEYHIPMGKAVVRRPGSDLSLISYGSASSVVAEAAEAMFSEGIDVEVLDLRSLVPMDWPAILESASKTERVVVVHDAAAPFGVGAEVSATIYEQCGAGVTVRRVGAPNEPPPFSSALSQDYFPSSKKIIQAARSLL